MHRVFYFALLIVGLAACQLDPHPQSENTHLSTTALDPSALTLERLVGSPSLSGPTPRGVKFSPDGKRVSFLKPRADDQNRLDLWAFDVSSGKQAMLVDSKLLEPDEVVLSEEEKALRERKRIAGTRGIVDYDWGASNQILVPLGGDLYLVTLSSEGPGVRRLTETDAFEYDAKISPKGRYVSFIRDGALFAIDLATGTEAQLSPSAEPGKAVSFGVAEFVAQEEMNRFTGYWWSADDRYVAYTRVDESSVDIVPRFDIAADKVTVIEQRYPRAGRPNAIVGLFVRDIETGLDTEIHWYKDLDGARTDHYLTRVKWTGTEVMLVQAMERSQRRLVHKRVSLVREAPGRPLSGLTQTLWEETQPNWINLSSDWSALDDEYILTSEADGIRRVFRYGMESVNDGPPYANLNRTLTGLTPKEMIVDAVGLAAPDQQRVFFTGWQDDPLQRHLYAVPVSGGKTERITSLGQSWSIIMAPDGLSFVGTSSSPVQPPQTGLYRISKEGAELIAWIEQNQLDPDHPYTPYLKQHTVPEFGTLAAEDGQTLYYSIQKPKDFDSRRKYPVIVEVYGGPTVQTVTNDWGPLTDVFYNQQGFIVFRLDNRGSSNRSKIFGDVIYRRTGNPEVRDQLQGVEWLKRQPFVDDNRIAIQGWSYGGYMTLMTILQAPEGTFSAAVAGAPVTDWALYDTFYTERYMDLPQDNAEGYQKSSVLWQLDQRDGKLPPLLLVHGMADDNVTFDNTTRLMAKLQEKGIAFDLMTYPGQRHGIRGEPLQIHLMRTRLAFLNRHLNPEMAE